MRSWVRGIEFVTADGEAGWLARKHAVRKERQATPADRRQLAERLLIEDRFAEVKTTLQSARTTIRECFPATRKNTAGYALDQYLQSGDLVDLVIGSEGTLGVVTRVELQLDHVPRATGTLLLALSDLNTVGEVVGLLLEHDPVAIELLDRTFLDLVASHPEFDVKGVGGLLIVEFERSSQADLRDVMAAAERVVAASCLWRRSGIADRDRERLWSIRKGASPALAALPPDQRSLQIVEDGCVPLSALSRYLEGVRRLADDAGIQVVAFGHAGDGHIHVNALVDTTVSGFEARLEQLLDEVGALVIELGGTPSGEHGDGRLRATMLKSLYGAEIAELFGRVKKAFDPKGILNPGIIISETAKSPLDDLKVGPGAAEIPIAVSNALHRIERAAAWDIPPLAILEERE
jgi:FAD/FMN-containing dehydrogenase